MKRIAVITYQRLFYILYTIGLSLIALSMILLMPAPAQSRSPNTSDQSPAISAPICFTSLGSTTEFSYYTALPVQQAVDAASPYSVVKVAGVCNGVQLRDGLSQTGYITKPITLRGGYTTTDWTTSNPMANPTLLDAFGLGRVIYATANISLENLIIQNGYTTFTNGGGIFAQGTLALNNTQILSNTAGGNGGGASAVSAAIVRGALFRNNRGDASGGGLYALGVLTLSSTQFISNAAMFYGGGLYADDALIATNSVFISNTATTNAQDYGFGGGAYAGGSATLITGGLFQSNHSGAEGGGLFIFRNLILTGTQFISNATTSGGDELVIENIYGGHSRVVNAVFKDNPDINDPTNNASIVAGGAITSSTDFIHVTTVGSGSSDGFYFYGGTAHVTDTIITNYSIGIHLFSGSAYADYDLFFNNGSNMVGPVITGTHNLVADPRFVNPAVNNYHIRAGSAATGQGVNAGVNTDLDGHTRPGIFGFDMGAYQYAGAVLRVYLPLAVKNF